MAADERYRFARSLHYIPNDDLPCMLQVRPLDAHSKEQLSQALTDNGSTMLGSPEARDDRGGYPFLDNQCPPYVKIFSMGQRGLQLARDIESLLSAGGGVDAGYFHITLPSESSCTVIEHGTAACSVGDDALATLLELTHLVLLVGDIADTPIADAVLRMVLAALTTELLTLAFLVGSETTIHPAHTSKLPTVLDEVATWIHLPSNDPHASETLPTGIRAILAVASYQPGVLCVDFSDIYWLFKHAGQGRLLVLDDLSAADAPPACRRALASLCPESQSARWPHKLLVEIRGGCRSLCQSTLRSTTPARGWLAIARTAPPSSACRWSRETTAGFESRFWRRISASGRALMS